MPRRTNAFQTPIALIERQIAQPGVTVIESKLVKDEAIREDREVDVHLVINDGQATTTVGHPRYFILQLAESPLDGKPLWADPRAHRATHVAPNLIASPHLVRGR